MRTLLVCLVLSFSFGCMSQARVKQRKDNRKARTIETNKYIAETMECSWSDRHSVCVCTNNYYREGYMSIAPDRVCKK